MLNLFADALIRNCFHNDSFLSSSFCIQERARNHSWCLCTLLSSTGHRIPLVSFQMEISPQSLRPYLRVGTDAIFLVEFACFYEVLSVLLEGGISVIGSSWPARISAWAIHILCCVLIVISRSFTRFPRFSSVFALAFAFGRCRPESVV